jgi:autotransporter-associated beta strand protein
MLAESFRRRWSRWLGLGSSRKPVSRPLGQRPGRFTPRLEALEDRLVPSWIGATSGSTIDSAHNYNLVSNWAGGVIDDSFQGVTLTGNLSLYLSANRTTPSAGLNLNYLVNYGTNYSLTLQSNNSTARTLTLSGDVQGDFGGPAGGRVTIGSVANPVNISLGPQRAINVAGAGDTLDLVNVVSGGNLSLSGNGTLQMDGANTYTGTTSIAGGRVQIAADAALGSTRAPLSLNGGTLAATGTFQLNSNRSISLGSNQGTINVAAGKTLTFNGYFGGVGGLTKDGGGTLIVGGVERYQGATTVNGGTFRLGVANSLESTTALVVNTGGTLDMGGFDLQVGDTHAPTLSGHGTITDNGAAATLSFVQYTNSDPFIDANLSGALSLVINAQNYGGGVRLTGANNYTGGTTVEGGAILTCNSSNALSPYSALTFISGDVDLNGHDQQVGGLFCDSSSYGTIDTVNAAMLTVNGGGNFSGILSGVGLTKTGAGTLTLSASEENNTYAQTIVSGGTLQLGCIDALPDDTNLTVNAGGTLDLAGHGAGVLSLAGAGTITDSSAAGSTFYVYQGTFSGSLSGTLSLDVDGFTLTLSPNSTSINNYTGNTTVSLVSDGQGGYQPSTLALASKNALPTGTTLRMDPLTTLDMGGFDQEIGGMACGAGYVMNGTGATLTVDGGGSCSLYLDHTSLVEQGTGVLTLDTFSNYRDYGGVTVNGGTLMLYDDVLSQACLTVNSGCIVNLDSPGSCVHVGSLEGAGTVNGVGDASGNKTILQVNNGGAFSGSLSGALSLDVIGGTLTLSPNNTSNNYTGYTSVEGTLKLGAFNALPTGTALSIAGSGTVDLGGFNQTVGSLSGSGEVYSLLAATLTVSSGGNGNFSGYVSPNARIVWL